MAKIPEEVLDILAECRVEGDTLYLPNVQLDRKLYVAVNKVLENIWSTSKEIVGWWMPSTQPRT